MIEKKDLLVEIGTEELPPKALLHLSEAFQDLFASKLKKNDLNFDKIEVFATPRRLALRVCQLDVSQAQQTITRKGPSFQAAYNEHGKPTKAAIGFSRSCGVEVSDLELIETEQGSWLAHQYVKSGINTAELVPDMVRESLHDLPIPKRMRWGNLNSEFVRPVHWVVILFGSESIPATIMDVSAGRSTKGHRFHHPDYISLSAPSDYELKLREIGYVEPVFSRRKQKIQHLVENLAKKIKGTVHLESSLLEEVTSLNEWPVAIMGSFDEKFLEVPPEVIIETMQKHQKYFPIFSGSGRLLPNFITISNIDSLDPTQVISGNERVIRPRFKDAAFFWEKDLSKPLVDLVPELEKVIFQRQLGTLKDKSDRIATISKAISDELKFDSALVKRAAQLSKCDLLTNMVQEFSGLQGTMGRYYATKNGEHTCVASAIEEQYLPRYSGDRLPKSTCGQILALADRVDSLVGIFSIGQKPTGVKDPYGLRRASLGVLRILIETPLNLDLRNLLNISSDSLAGKIDASKAVNEVFQYMLDRLFGYYIDKNIPPDVIESVFAVNITVPIDIDIRIYAVIEFNQLPEARSLSAANKRINNILKKNELPLPRQVDQDKLLEKAEQSFYDQIIAIKKQIKPLLQRRQYGKALSRLSNLKPIIDKFFDEVMVFTDDIDIRLNRLALLESVSLTFQEIADISKLR